MFITHQPATIARGEAALYPRDDPEDETYEEPRAEDYFTVDNELSSAHPEISEGEDDLMNDQMRIVTESMQARELEKKLRENMKRENLQKNVRKVACAPHLLPLNQLKLSSGKTAAKCYVWYL